MKSLYIILVLTVSTGVFYSCSNNIVTSSPQQEIVEWQLIDSVDKIYVNCISIVDENNIYLSDSKRGYRINNRVKTEIDFHNISFFSELVDAYSNNYFVFGGRHSLSVSNTAMKIFSDSGLTNVILDTNSGYGITALKILQPGKILAASANTLYMYENDIVTSFPNATEGLIYKIIKQGGTIYLAASANNSVEHLIYKFENNNFILLDRGDDTRFRMSTDDAVIKKDVNISGSNLSYWGSNGWAPLFNDAVDRDYYKAIGENLNYIYFFTFGADGINGLIWNGSKLIDDINYQSIRSYHDPVSFSNMRSNTFFISTQYNNKAYIYKGKRKM